MNTPVAAPAHLAASTQTITQHKLELVQGRAQLRAAFAQNPSPGQLLKLHTALVDRVLR